MGQLGSRFVRRTLFALASIVAFLALLVASAHLGFVRTRVLDWARTRLSSDLGIVVDADSLRYNLLTPSIELRNVRLSAPRDRPFLEADAIRIALNRRALLGVLELERLELDRPRVTIVRHRDGAVNLPAAREGPSSAPTPIHLGRVALSAMSFEFEDEAAGHHVTAAPIDLTLDTRAGAAGFGAVGPIPLAVRIGSTDPQVPPRALSGTLAGSLSFDGSRLTVQEIRVDAPEGRVALDGWIDLIAETVRVEARGRLETDLAAAGHLAGGPAASLAGSATADVELRGAVADPTVTVAIQGRSLRFQSAPEVDLSAAATYTAGRVEIDRVAVTSGVGAIEASGTLALPGDSGTPPRESRLTGRIEGVDIDGVMKAAGVALPLDVGSTAAGRIDVALDSSVPLTPDAWRQSNVSGSIQLSADGSGLAMEGRLDVTMRGGRWTIEHALRSPVGRASLDGAVSGGVLFDDARTHGLSGSTRLQLQELHSLLPVLQQAGVALPAPLDQIDGAVDARIEPRGALAAPTVHATIDGRGVRLPGVADDGALNLTLTIDRTGLTAKSLDARLGSLRVAASGAFTWQEQIESRFEATADDLNALAAAFGLEPGSIAGSSEIKGSLRGTVRSPRAQAQLTARNVSAYGVAVGPVAAGLQFGDDRLDLDADARDLAVRLKGRLGTREPFGFDAEAILDGSRVPALLPAAQVEDLSVDGTITATVRARGDIRHLAAAAGEVELRALDASLAGVPVVLVAPGMVSLEATAIAATPLRIRVGRETDVRLQGSLATNAVRDGIDVHVEGTLADLLTIAAPALPDLPIETGSSRVSVDLHVGGTLTSPQPAGTAALRAATLRYADVPPFTDVVLDARIEPARIALQTLTSQWQGAMLTAAGALPFRMIVPEPRSGATGVAAWGSNWLSSLPDEPRAATLTARATGITTDALAPFVDPAQLQRISGTVNASVSAEASGFSLDALQASVVLDEASLDLAGVPFAQSVPTRVRLERSQARVEELRWNAQGNELRASGGVDLSGPDPTIDLVVDGDLDLRMLGAFAPGLAAGGVAQTALTVKGPLASPQIVGGMDVASGELRLETPSVSASDFYGSITVDAGRNATVSLNGFVNGGPTSVWGNLALEDLSSPSGRISLAAWSVMLEYPEGFQTESNADLSLTLAPSASTLAGRIDVLSGIYREPIVVSQSLLAGFGRSGGPSVSSESSLLTNLRLDVTVATADDIRVDNNYGRLNLSANLQVTGSAARPGMVGRVEAEPDGEVYLAGNTYRVQTFTVDLNNPRTLAPDVTFLAETRVGNIPIEIALQCSASGPCEREVRSQAAGVTNEEAEAALFGISADPEAAGAQLARLLSGELLGIVSGSIGLDTLRLEQGAGARSDLFDDPTLVAGDVNPASRLTVGKRLGDRVELAYSQDLSQNGFVMSTTYHAPAGISFRALLLDNEDRSYEFRHEPRFSGRRRQRPVPRPGAIVSAVRFNGTPGFAENELRGQLRVTEGDRFEFAAWQEDRDRLGRFYQARGFFESRVRARRTVEEQADAASAEPALDAVTLEYVIEQGPPTRLEVAGFDLSDDVRRRIVERWAGASFDRFLERDVTVIVREHLYQLGRLRATVKAAIASVDDGARVLRVDIDPGPVTTPQLEIAGNESVATATLFNTAESLGPLAAWLDPPTVELAIERLYQELGFLSANVEVLEPDVQDGASVVRIAIREGGAWQIGGVTVGGAEQLSKGGTIADLGLAAGSRYDPAAIAESIAGLEQRFRDEGFLDVRVESETVLDHAARRATVHVLVAPGPRSVLASIEVDGARADDPGVARRLNFSVGGPVSASALSAARRRLYETGTYRSVEIAVDPAAGTAAPGPISVGDRPVVVRVRVEERPRYNFRYGLAVSSDSIGADERDTRLGFAADLENRNLLGRGLTVGLSARLRRDQEVARGYLSANRFFGLPLRSNVFLSRGRQDVGSDAPPADGSEPIDIISDSTEVSAEQVYRLRRFVDLRYGYDLGRNRTTGPAFDLTVRVARLTTSAVIDRRNDPFDPVRGWFTSGNVELSRPGIGSELSFLRSYFQLYHFTPVRREVVVASAARVGMARTYRGEPLIPTERFFGGGATSVRGYYEDDLGPRSIFGDAEGGSALFMANGEVRFPIYRWARGVGFVDLGDVYATVGDILQSGVQVGAGGGIRLNTPVGLLRLDLGVPVNPRPFDPKWRLHFGLGHSF